MDLKVVGAIAGTLCAVTGLGFWLNHKAAKKETSDEEVPEKTAVETKEGVTVYRVTGKVDVHVDDPLEREDGEKDHLLEALKETYAEMRKDGLLPEEWFDRPLDDDSGDKGSPLKVVD